MTGAAAPANTAVLPVEWTDQPAMTAPCTVSLTDQAPDRSGIRQGTNIARCGEDGLAGDCVLAAGQRLRASSLAVAAMAGCTEVHTYCLPTAHIFTTGAEVGAGHQAAICDSNGPFLQSLLQSLQVTATQQHMQDELQTLSAAAQQCQADIIISTGSVSMGVSDIVPAAAKAAGFRCIFHGIALQPGKPVFLAQHQDGRCWLGLPGNPVSVVATSQVLLSRLIGRFAGGWLPPSWNLPLVAAVANRKRRHQLLPARFRHGGIEVIPWNGSGDLLAAGAGDGLVSLPPQQQHDAGDIVTMHPYLDGLAGECSQLLRHLH